jgi:hypothetical protein
VISNENGRVEIICWMVDVEDGIRIGETRYLVGHPIPSFDEFVKVPGNECVEFSMMTVEK